MSFQSKLLMVLSGAVFFACSSDGASTTAMSTAGNSTLGGVTTVIGDDVDARADEATKEPSGGDIAVGSADLVAGEDSEGNGAGLDAGAGLNAGAGTDGETDRSGDVVIGGMLNEPNGAVGGEVVAAEDPGVNGGASNDGNESQLEMAGEVGGSIPGGSAAEEQPDWSALFDPPTDEELEAVRADWSSRDDQVRDWREENVQTAAGFRVKIVSHVVDGFRHYGYIRYPKGFVQGERYPVLVLNHGGNGGHDLGQGLFFSQQVSRICAETYFVVAPSFRGEGLRARINGIEREFMSEGPRLDDDGYWSGVLDRDVDDTLHLLNGALGQIEEMDADRIGIHGGSRGAGVSYLMAARDPRIKLLGLYYGATNHISPEIENEIAVHIETGAEIRGRDVNLAWTVAVQPYRAGTISFEAARQALLRRSVLYFADTLPTTQFHHGTNDTAVSVEQSRAMVQKRLTIPESRFDYYEYEGAGHDVMSLRGAASRTTHDESSDVNVIGQDEMHRFLCELEMAL